MIPTLYGRAGESVSLEGVANDFDKAIVAVEFSLDDGAHWTRYDTPGTTSARNLYWGFCYTPRREGEYDLLIRSVNEDGCSSPIPEHVHMIVS